jgi:hypothetical protein
MSKLTEAADNALRERQKAATEQRKRDLDAMFEKLKERWANEYWGFGRLMKDGYDAGPMPPREAFEYIPYPGVRCWSGGRWQGNAPGWRVEVDGVAFLFSTGQNDSSLFLIHTCPKCGVEGASSFSSLHDLGLLLRNGPKDYQHTCREREAREVAYAIASAARDLKIRPDEVVELAYELHQDLIYRVMEG